MVPDMTRDPVRFERYSDDATDDTTDEGSILPDRSGW